MVSSTKLHLLKRTAYIGIALSLSVVTAAYGGKLFDEWPDVIICSKKSENGTVSRLAFVVIRTEQSDSMDDRCWKGQKPRYRSATYAQLHYHYSTSKGGLEADGTSLMEFCGSAVEDAIAWVAPYESVTDDCRAGVAISELKANGQTRDF